MLEPLPEDQELIQYLTKELVDTVEQRNALVEMLEEERLRWVWSRSTEGIHPPNLVYQTKQLISDSVSF